ncbi:hypothetical protein [Rhodococcus jostii]|nr:hypothetical protein [Rhodococcus jostii]
MPVFDEWLAAGIVPRDFYRTVGEEMARVDGGTSEVMRSIIATDIGL